MLNTSYNCKCSLAYF